MHPTHDALDVIVIGAGQAGLATAYHLRRRGLRFLVVDAAHELGGSWRIRWDSLRLFTPAQYDGLPGMPFPAPADTHPTKDQVADYLTASARSSTTAAAPRRRACSSSACPGCTRAAPHSSASSDATPSGSRPRSPHTAEGESCHELAPGPCPCQAVGQINLIIGRCGELPEKSSSCDECVVHRSPNQGVLVARETALVVKTDRFRSRSRRRPAHPRGPKGMDADAGT